jgi:aminoglycoside phosphotransferase (APT) family kinase protein
MTAEAQVPATLVDRERLAGHLREHLGDGYGRFDVRRLGEGQSCLTFMLEGAGWNLVLRRPPRGDLPPTAFDVTREFRVMSAIRDSGAGLPVPRPVLLCTDREVLGVPFYVMEPVDGLVLRESAPAGFGPDRRAALAESAIDVLTRLHGLDWRGIGLADFGNPDAYAERQLRRMQKLWERARFRPLPEVDAVGDWLRDNVPHQSRAAVVHGDYKLDNVIVDEATGAVAAVVDWELSTIGDPTADLGWLLYYWLDDRAELRWPRMPAVMLADGFPTRAELLERYARSGGPVAPEAVAWYAVLAGWKTAIMLEGSYRRFVEGTADVATYAALEAGVPFLANRALGFATGALRIV